MRWNGLLLCVAAIACHKTSTEGTGASPLDLNGSHVLVAYNGQSLPVHLSPIFASQNGDLTGCFLEVGAGVLQLTVADGSGAFQLQYSSRNSCTGAPSGTYSWSGQVRVNGNQLLLSSVGADGLVTTETATVAGAAILLAQTPLLSFALQPLLQ
jgi:hypothetical protein